MAEWVELRVHGVSGTPPDYLLASAHTVQVAGDDRTRSFRPADGRGREQRADDGHVLEAFHWGRWTSGSWMQGLWLLLIPFGIVNAAAYMLPAPTSRSARWARAGSRALLRLVALVLTALFALATGLVVVDLAGWQWLLRGDLPVAGWLVLDGALAVAALLIAGLSRLGAVETGRRYRFAHAGPRDLGRGSAGVAGLGDAAFFDGDPDTPALRRLHRAAGLLVVAWLGLSAAADAGARWATGGRWVPVGLLAVVAVAVLLSGDPQRSTVRRADGAWRWLAGAVAVSVRVLATLSVVAALVAVAGREVDGQGPLPGTEGAVGVLILAGFAGLALLLLAVAVVAVTTRRAAGDVPAPYRRFAGGLGAGLASAVACYLAVGFTAGLTLGVQGLLDLGGASVAAPALLERFAYAWGVTAAVFVVLGLATAVRLRLRRRLFVDRVRAAMTFGEPPRSRLPSNWVARTARAVQRARLTDAAPTAVLVWTVLGLVLAVPIGIALALEVFGAGGEPPPPLHLLTGVRSDGDVLTGDDIVIGLGQVTLLTIGVGTLLLARGALRSEGARRGLNVVWDVVAFWPRSTHPFVPAPYAQEVVPALVRRICWHLGVPDPLRESGQDDAGAAGPADRPEPADEVVVAAHSQGTLLSLVALLWLPPEIRHRVRWLTFGSPLRTQFARGFPHYVTADLLRDVAASYRWISLYRDTDPVGGPVTSWDHSPDGGPLYSRRLGRPQEPQPDALDPRTGRRACGDEWRLLDPPPTDVALQTGAIPGVGGHSGYWTDPDWPLALDVVRGRGAAVAARARPAQTARAPVPRAAQTRRV
jgi:hypothetical protein